KELLFSSPARLLGRLRAAPRRSTSVPQPARRTFLKPLGLLFCASFFQRTSSDYETVCLVSKCGCKSSIIFDSGITCYEKILLKNVKIQSLGYQLFI
ncbi:MAG: hypothetical protein IKW93_00060, partial [Bacteroidales bacterium]|nr:hypothetical protein [Bacteroidales bacterium]